MKFCPCTDAQKKMVGKSLCGYFLLPSEAQAIKMAMAVGQPVNIMKNSCKAAIYTSAFVNCVKSLDQTS